jgi:hypothetical protein
MTGWLKYREKIFCVDGHLKSCRVILQYRCLRFDKHAPCNNAGIARSNGRRKIGRIIDELLEQIRNIRVHSKRIVSDMRQEIRNSDRKVLLGGNCFSRRVEFGVFRFTGTQTECRKRRKRQFLHIILRQILPAGIARKLYGKRGLEILFSCHRGRVVVACHFERSLMRRRSGRRREKSIIR